MQLRADGHGYTLKHTTKRITFIQICCITLTIRNAVQTHSKQPKNGLIQKSIYHQRDTVRNRLYSVDKKWQFIILLVSWQKEFTFILYFMWLLQVTCSFFFLAREVQICFTNDAFTLQFGYSKREKYSASVWSTFQVPNFVTWDTHLKNDITLYSCNALTLRRWRPSNNTHSF